MNRELLRRLPLLVLASWAVATALWFVAGDDTTRGLAELWLAPLLAAGLALALTLNPRG